MLKLKNITKTFNPGTITEKKALQGVDLELDDGDFVTVIGGNGAGKSTLLNLIAGVHYTDTGSIELDGMNLTGKPEHFRAKFLGRVFQDPMMGTAANMEIEENLAMAMRRGKKRGLAWHIKNEERNLYRDKLALLDLGLENRMNHLPSQLSGGERQRVAVARALINNPSLILADEPTGNLDPENAVLISDLLFSMADKYKKTLILVTHDVKLAAKGSVRYTIKRGKIEKVED